VAAPKNVEREQVYRLRRAGYSAKDISVRFSVTRQAVYYLLKNMPPMAAFITPCDEGILVASGDISATATAIRSALKESGWDVEG